MMNTKSILGLVTWLLITFAAAGIGAVASANAGEFYEKLSRPGWAPPASLFGPVWSVLYLLIAIAAWLVWKEGGFRGASLALSMMILQLAANALWTWIFFAWHRGAAAFAEIIVLWILIVITMILFWKMKPVAGALFVPYLLWVTFASALTYSMWQRNPQVL